MEVSVYYHINVSVPYVCVLTSSYDQTFTPVGVNGGALPCVRLACATSGDCVTKEPHLSPQHYELNAKQHVLDRTRVSVSRRYSKGNAANKLGGSRCADLTATDACEAMHPPKPKDKTGQHDERLDW